MALIVHHNRKNVYDVHLDPQLEWTGKTENKVFEVDTVSLYVDESLIL
jgi:adenine-specific DNA-methyltransferase